MIEVSKLLSKPLTHVDLGGGLGITYKNEKSPDLKKYCDLIIKHFGKNSALQIILEPGRTIAGNAGILVSKVLYRKPRSQKDFLIIDAGMNDLFRPALYSSHHEIIPIKEKSKNEKMHKYDIVGPVCESTDCLGSNRMLPNRMKYGDLMAILSTGAYGFSMAGNYNSRCRPAEVLVNGNQFKLIRKRETYEDLIRGES